MQEEPGLRAPVQAVMSVGGLRAKSAKVAPALRPPMAKVGRFMAIWPVLVTCTVKRLLESPTTTVPRFRVAGETPMEGGVSPVPVSVAETDATPRVLVATVNVAVVAPAALGVKTMETVQVQAQHRRDGQKLAGRKARLVRSSLSRVCTHE